MLTHAAPRVERLAERVRRAGHEALAVPTLRIVPAVTARHALAAVRGRDRYEVASFVSPGAVQAFFAADVHWPSGRVAAAIGPGTASALRERLPPAVADAIVVPAGPTYDADALLETPAMQVLADRAVLVVTGERGRDDWIATLQARGARVERLRAYRTAPCPPDAAALAVLDGWLDEPDDSARPRFVYASRSSVGALGRSMRERGRFDAACRCRAFAIHVRIADALRADGWRDVAVVAPGESALLHALESV